MADATQITSPFRNVPSFEASGDTAPKLAGLASPFIQAFTFEGSASEVDLRGGNRRALLAELHDEELDEALYELAGEAAAYSANGGDARVREAALITHFAPLTEEIEALLQRAAETFGTRGTAGLTESEIDEVLSHIEPERQLPPEFEQFFGKIKKAVGRIAKKAISFAGKIGLGPIIAKLKGMVKPLIQNVIKKAINRLPAAVRPAANILASKLTSLFGKEIDGVSETELAFDVSDIQSEFNEWVADALLDEPGETRGAPEYQTSIDDLDGARERFISDLEQLGDGEDAGPAVERFIPALLPALKLGLKIVGRKRVVDMLAKLVSKLIGKLVGPAASVPLSAALVDTGLKLLGLEVSPGDRRRTVNAAIADTVEETVRQVVALGDETLDNESLLEGAIVHAFEDAAASNLPPVLSENVYLERPELAETDSHQGMWIPCPVRGPARYKKFSRAIRTRITPHAALKIPTFDGATLAQYTQEQLGLEAGVDLEADVYLYETRPGTNLAEVARLEANGAGPASVAEFHPLTPEAAALLLREPGLARANQPVGYGAARNLGAGQRVYRVVVPGRRVAAIPGTGGKRETRRRTSVYTVLDFQKERIALYLFVSERRAQQLAAQLRKQGHAGTVATSLKDFIDRGIAAAIGGAVTGRIRLIHEALELNEARGAALRRLPTAQVRAFGSRIGEWVMSGLTTFLSSQSTRVIAATEDTKDGVTFTFTLSNPPGLSAMRKALGGKASAGNGALSGSPSAVQVDVTPGFTNG